MPNYKKAKCQNCNNETLMEIRDFNKNETGSILDDNYFYDMQVVLFCPICKTYNIINAYWDQTYGQKQNYDEYEDIYNKDCVEETFLYPVTSNLLYQKSDLVPKTILNTFDKAIQLKNYDDESCLVKLRKTLEIICNDKGATGNNLYEKLSNMSDLGILPKTLNSASTLTRKLGNLGAHLDNIEISPPELKIVIELVEYIIQYLYVLPEEIKRLETRFSSQNN